MYTFADILEMEMRNHRIHSPWWWQNSMFSFCFQTGNFPIYHCFYIEILSFYQVSNSPIMSSNFLKHLKRIWSIPVLVMLNHEVHQKSFVITGLYLTKYCNLFSIYRLKVMCVLNEQLIYEDVFPDVSYISKTWNVFCIDRF